MYGMRGESEEEGGGTVSLPIARRGREVGTPCPTLRLDGWRETKEVQSNTLPHGKRVRGGNSRVEWHTVVGSMLHSVAKLDVMSYYAPSQDNWMQRNEAQTTMEYGKQAELKIVKEASLLITKPIRKDVRTTFAERAFCLTRAKTV